MKKRIILIILVLNFTISAIGQNFVKIDTIKITSNKINELTDNRKIILSQSLDFTGDNKKDFIITTELDENEHKFCEYWISNDFRKIREVETYKDGIQIRKFINLDNDPELEIIDASGYEDGIDYTIKNIDLKSGKLKTVLFFNPVIESNGKKYWGYPWDWTKLKINSNRQIKTSLEHKIERDGNIKIPENQRIMPVIYFEGNPSQESYVEKIQEVNWITLNELITNSR